MKIIGNFLRRMVSRNGEKGEYSAGYWPGKVRSKLSSLAPKTGSYLEVGCGEGLFLKDLRIARPELFLTGADNWEEILRKAGERHKGDPNVRLFLSSGEKLPFGDSVFDAAAAVNLLINIKERVAAEGIVKELLRVVKSGGSIYFDIRNSASFFLSVQYGLARFYDPDIRVPLNRNAAGDFDHILEGTEIKRHCIGFTKRAGRRAPIIIIEAKKK